MSETETVDAETLRMLRADKARYKADRDEAWAACANGSCDGAVYATAELSRLRGVVEAVQALADEWIDRDPTWPTATAVISCGQVIRSALASVPSSGEAGERVEAFVELLPPDVGHNLRHFGPETRHVTGHDCHCRPEQIPHAPASPEPTGADEGVAQVVDAILTEHFGHTVYEATDAEPEECHDECAACLAGEQITALLAARPVLSREAVADLLVQQTVRVQVPNVGTVTGFLRRESAEALAAVLVGQEER